MVGDPHAVEDEEGDDIVDEVGQEADKDRDDPGGGRGRRRGRHGHADDEKGHGKREDAVGQRLEACF